MNTKHIYIYIYAQRRSPDPGLAESLLKAMGMCVKHDMSHGQMNEFAIHLGSFGSTWLGEPINTPMNYPIVLLGWLTPRSTLPGNLYISMDCDILPLGG